MLRWGILLSAVFVAPPALAGPWVRQDEALYSRIAVSRGNVENLDAVRIDAYSEYGLSDRWTLTLKYERVSFEQFDEFDADGWRSTVRRGFNLAPGLVASLEGGLLHGEAIGGAAGCAALGVEARAGLGQSFEYGKRDIPMYWFAEAALRGHDDGCQRQRLELGFGQQITPRVWTISQVWFDEGSVNSPSSKYQFEYLWRTDNFDVSAGTYLEFGGAFEESAFFMSLAKAF